MRESQKIVAVLQTYDGNSNNNGFGMPIANAEIEITDQGIALQLPLANGQSADVYIERRPDHWVVNVSPTSDDIAVVVQVKDNASYAVSNSMGGVVLQGGE